MNLKPSRRLRSKGSRLREGAGEAEIIRAIRLPAPPITIHEIPDYELKRIREGAPDSIYFTLWLSLSLAALSIMASLLLPYKLLLLVFAALLFGAGIMSGLVWFRRFQRQRLENRDGNLPE